MVTKATSALLAAVQMLWFLWSITVFEVIRTILGLFIFFYKKILSGQKRKSNHNQLTKQKYANIKQQRQQFFAHTKTSKRVKIFCFAFCCFFYAQNFFVKNNKQTQNCPDNLKYNTTEVYPLLLTYGELFFTNLAQIFFITFTYFFVCILTSSYLLELIFIYKHLYEC